MDNPWIWLLTLVVSFFIGVLSAFTGGGGGMLGVPFFLAIGLTPIQALGTGKFSGLAIAAGSVPKFLKQNVVDKELARKLLPISVVSSMVGPLITFNLPEDNLQKIIGIIILLVAPTMLINKKDISKRASDVKGKRLYLGMLVFFVVSTLQAAMGSGTGSLLVIVLLTIFSLPPLKANATKRLVGLPLVSITALIFLAKGAVAIPIAISSGIGNYFGGRLGAKLAVDKGNEYVKYGMFVILMIVGARLVLG